jgi:hypothetical protein
MGAYDPINVELLSHRLQSFLPRINLRVSETPDWAFAKGLLTHYYVLKPEDYDQLSQENP